MGYTLGVILRALYIYIPIYLSTYLYIYIYATPPPIDQGYLDEFLLNSASNTGILVLEVALLQLDSF